MVYDLSVKITCTSIMPDLDNPWSPGNSVRSAGSGFVLSETEIITCAHVVENARFIKVKKEGNPQEFTAKLQYISYDSDLALLQVEPGHLNPYHCEFLRGFPELSTEVEVIGYPFGEDSLSITEGVLSRIQSDQYIHSGKTGLLYKVDAAINSGNSGGPVIVGGNLLGIAFQVVAEAENVGHVIPATIVDNFLECCKHQVDYKFPDLGLNLQPTINPMMRGHLGLTEHAHLGALVIGTHPSIKSIETGDVLLAIDSYEVNQDASVYLDENKVAICISGLGSLFSAHTDVNVNCKILRNKKVELIQLNLEDRKCLVKSDPHQPRYMCFAGFVFEPLTKQLITAYEQAPIQLYNLWSDNEITDERKEAVVITNLLDNDMTYGYEFAENCVVECINNFKVRDFKHLTEILLDNLGKTVDIQLTGGEKIILDLSEFDLFKNQDLCNLYGVNKFLVE